MYFDTPVLGSPYILLLIAVLGLKNTVCKETAVAEIAGIGEHLRVVPGELVQCQSFISLKSHIFR
jgi:hypothetical protein